MTEPTDAELLALIEKHLGFKPRRDDTVIDPRTGRFHDVQRYRDMKADILAKWGTPPAVVKWAPEEIADGERGIRWVTNDGIHGRPTDHDVREYLKRTPTAHGCHCDECKQFYTTQQPVAKVDWIGASSHHLMQKPDCGGESCDCRSYYKKEGGHHG